MNIEDKINESKKRTQIMNSVTIDWQYALQILPVVLPTLIKETNETSSSIHEIKDLSKTLNQLFLNIETNINQLKEMVNIKN